MTFLEKYNLLRKSVPVTAISIGPYTVGSEYVDQIYRSKNCYYCFDSADLRDSMYSTIGIWCSKIVDCDAITESEKCYKCISCTKCHNCTYLLDSNNSTDCHYSAFLNSCTNCFGCVALTHKKYCIFNIQYPKEEYFKKIEELKKEKPEKILSQMFALKEKIPHPASQQFGNENCPYGDYIYNSKNSYWCFNSYYCENSGYSYVTALVKNCWDFYFSGGDTETKSSSENCYEFMYSVNGYNCAFLFNCEDSTNCFYSADLKNCTDCFGCVGLTNKKYCILNNQLTKEQYERTVKDIKKELGWRV